MVTCPTIFGASLFTSIFLSIGFPFLYSKYGELGSYGQTLLIFGRGSSSFPLPKATLSTNIVQASI